MWCCLLCCRKPWGAHNCAESWKGGVGWGGCNYTANYFAKLVTESIEICSPNQMKFAEGLVFGKKTIYKKPWYNSYEM